MTGESLPVDMQRSDLPSRMYLILKIVGKCSTRKPLESVRRSGEIKSQEIIAGEDDSNSNDRISYIVLPKATRQARAEITTND